LFHIKTSCLLWLLSLKPGLQTAQQLTRDYQQLYRYTPLNLPFTERQMKSLHI
jgi:hypothetical protein